MANDRITEVRIQGLRTLADVRLRLGGLTVLIGENGSGKSSLLEAFEILRKAAEPDFFSNLSRLHGGLANLLRVGATELRLQVSAEVSDVPLEYSVVLSVERSTPVVQQEELRAELAGIGPRSIVQRVRDALVLDMPYRLPGEPRMLGSVSARIGVPVGGLMFGGRLVFALSAEDERLLETFGQQHPQPVIERFAGLLRSIRVQLPFAIRPYWTSRELGDRFSLRDAATVAPAAALARSAENIHSCFHALKNEFPREHWDETMELVRLGLGDDIESVNTVASPSGGAISLSLTVHGWPRPIYAEALSDGQLAYLAFVALTRLPGEPSLIAIDEPETHFHPHLLARVLGMLEPLAERCPVVLATHSDRLLDALPDAAANVVLCELNQERATELRRPNAEALARWLEHYRGLGDMRSEGVDKLVVTDRD